MSTPYVGEIRMFGGNFAPVGWMFCNGQLLPIAEYDVLFNLIGTTYGGDGVSTFALPDLRGRTPAHPGSNAGTVVWGQEQGVESVTLTTQQIPSHAHPALGGAVASSTSPAGAAWGIAQGQQYSGSAPNANLANQALANTGGSQPHENRSPYLAISFIISLFGVFPSQG